MVLTFALHCHIEVQLWPGQCAPTDELIRGWYAWLTCSMPALHDRTEPQSCLLSFPDLFEQPEQV